MANRLPHTLAIAAVLSLMSATQATAQQGVPQLLQQLHNDLQRINASIDALATLGPKKPSDSIVLLPFLSDPCSGNGVTVNSQLSTDGSIVPFSLQAGQAFMVTGVDYGASTVPAGQRTGFVLSTVDNGVVLAEDYVVNTGASGATSGSMTLSSPMRITSALCVRRGLDQEVPPNRILIRGFLVPND